MNEYQLARNLSLFSLGLGLAELVAPRSVARLIGVSEEHEKMLQLLGLREIASGLGIMQGKPAHFLWSRVAGDIMDLTLLASVLNSNRSDRQRVEAAIVAVATVTAVDIIASVQHTRRFEDPSWRDRRPMESRGAISREDPAALRASADEAMQRYQSAHVKEPTFA
jgi:hypothetical protein